MKSWEFHILKQPKQAVFLGCERFLDVNCVKISAPSIHASLPKNTIFLYPETLSCFNDKGVRASSFLKWQEVEVGEVVPGGLILSLQLQSRKIQ